ncbi:UDP-glucose 4-epimerase family protein [Hydrogenophaga sp.]|uniref:UDP-glucose 4-epimerase family protein n=1 Tax=Hydrogenophaga sp. TaxID=1904254 RepID=UPI0035B2CE67
MKVLITGATGFVGQLLASTIQALGHDVVRAVRQTQSNSVLIGNVDGNTSWREALQGCDSVVHLAARVHVMNDQSADPLSEFRRVNVDGTANLARQAAAAGVRRFVFLSSAKVNGEATQEGQPFAADDTPAPEDPYGISKHEAELVLRQIAEETGMEVVIIRPPLVYGPGVKANFASMMRWLSRGIPLPLAAVTHNRRSLVALDNLVDLIVTCLEHPAAANQTFLVSDGEDLSTADLLRRMGCSLGRPARLFAVPTPLLKAGADLLHKPGIYQRLCGSLQLDIGKTRELLGWTPPLSVDEGLRQAAKGFRS